MKRRKSNFSLGAIVDEQGHNILVSLLKSHSQRGESILRREDREEISMDRVGKLEYLTNNSSQFFQSFGTSVGTL